MNKQIEDAIKDLKYQQDVRGKGVPYQVGDLTINTAIAALKKQLPKKVIGIKASLQNRYCPSCQEWMMLERLGEVNYCPNCGQHLDWSVDNE